MIRKFLTTVAVGSLVVGGIAASHVAFAEQAGDAPRAQRGGGMMMMADADKDGRLTRAELTAALDAGFAKMDVNNDGRIDQTDRTAMRAQRMEKRFARLDADGNGQISKAEFTAGHERRGPQASGDGNADGKRWGGRRHGRPGMGMMGGGMRGGDIAKADFQSRALAMFDRADADRDGAVTQDEMKAARSSMRAEWRAERGNRQAPPAAD